jgi:hypothetical protein
MESTTLPHFSSSSPNNLSLEEKITLTEMRKHPMESEAENYVLSAIEDMDQRRNSSVNEQQQVLPGVPDIAMHVFQTESTDGVKSTNHSRAHSNASFVSANNNSHATNSKRSTNHRPKMISRNATIEQTLSSLTEAMADLHGRKTDKIQVQADMILMDDPNAGSAGTCVISLSMLKKICNCWMYSTVGNALFLFKNQIPLEKPPTSFFEATRRMPLLLPTNHEQLEPIGANYKLPCKYRRELDLREEAKP